MQTFLPYSDFARSARVLDVRRLGKQRVETLQILRALTFDDYGWRNHPAVTMWAGHTDALVTYGVVVTRRWVRLGFSDTVAPQLLEFARQPLRTQRELADEGRLPPWLGSRALHRSHQAALLRKDPRHYGSLFPRIDPELPYVWPATEPTVVADGPVTGWVVRVDPELSAAPPDVPYVALRAVGDEEAGAPLGAGARNTKRRRQLTAFTEHIEQGDGVVVPLRSTLLLGTVTGAYEWRSDDPFTGHHVRAVRWDGQLHRSALRRPVHLQDPRVVFALRDEPALLPG